MIRSRITLIFILGEEIARVGQALGNGGGDWNAGVPACNIAAAALSASVLSNHNRLFVLGTHAGGTPAFQSVDDFSIPT